MITPIYIDIDVTINNFETAFLDFVYNQTGEQIPLSKWTTYYLKDAPNLPIEREKILDLMDAFHKPENLSQLKVREGVLKTLKQYKDKAQYHFITTRNSNQYPGIENLTCKWLISNGVTPNSNNIHFSTTKVEIAKTLDIKLGIEDSGELALNMAEEGIPTLLLSYPWNKTTGHKLITRVQDWRGMFNIEFYLNQILK
ncbi:MAG: hypothetical protein ABIF40_01850 [archaeon]